MSPDLERRLREAGEALAGPDAPATTRAREEALATAAARELPGARRVLAIGGMALAAVAIGMAIGSFAFAGRARPASREGSGFCPPRAGQCSNRARPRRQIAQASRWPRMCRCTRRTRSTASRTRHCVRFPRTASCWSRASCASTARRTPRACRCPCVKPRRTSGTAGRCGPRIRSASTSSARSSRVTPWKCRRTSERGSPRRTGSRRRSGSSIAWSSLHSRTAPLLGLRPAPTRITIAFQRFWYPPGNYYALRFYGAISSGRADEYVAVMHKPCRATVSTAVAGATTAAGGGWEVQPSFPPGAGEFRARWNDEVSEPVTYKPPLVPNVVKRPKRTYRVEVYSFVGPGASPVIMNGRFIELQRLSTAGRWTRIRREARRLRCQPLQQDVPRALHRSEGPDIEGVCAREDRSAVLELHRLEDLQFVVAGATSPSPRRSSTRGSSRRRFRPHPRPSRAPTSGQADDDPRLPGPFWVSVISNAPGLEAAELPPERPAVLHARDRAEAGQ